MEYITHGIWLPGSGFIDARSKVLPYGNCSY